MTDATKEGIRVIARRVVVAVGAVVFVGSALSLAVYTTRSTKPAVIETAPLAIAAPKIEAPEARAARAAQPPCSCPAPTVVVRTVRPKAQPKSKPTIRAAHRQEISGG